LGNLSTPIKCSEAAEGVARESVKSCPRAGCEDLAEEHNRVSLDPILKDTSGIPAPRIDYTLSDNTRRMMEHGIARASEILEKAGAKNISCLRTMLNSPGHLLGTARMGRDPARSVVNE